VPHHIPRLAQPSGAGALKEIAMNLVERVKRILLSPQTEWEVIDAESTTLTELYTGYIAPLAAIGPVARLIGYSVIGMSVPFGTYRVPFGYAITSAIVAYIMTLVTTYVLALIVDALAPTFNGKRSQIQALKVVAYSSTAFWVAGIFLLIPSLWILTLLGFYSLYLLYLGLPVLMKSPKEKAIGYTVVVVLVGIVLFMLSAAVSSRFIRVPGAAMTMP
jgi:hypothetical protein